MLIDNLIELCYKLVIMKPTYNFQNIAKYFVLSLALVSTLATFSTISGINAKASVVDVQSVHTVDVIKNESNIDIIVAQCTKNADIISKNMSSPLANISIVKKGENGFVTRYYKDNQDTVKILKNITIGNAHVALPVIFKEVCNDSIKPITTLELDKSTEGGVYSFKCDCAGGELNSPVMNKTLKKDEFSLMYVPLLMTLPTGDKSSNATDLCYNDKFYNYTDLGSLYEKIANKPTKISYKNRTKDGGYICDDRLLNKNITLSYGDTYNFNTKVKTSDFIEKSLTATDKALSVKPDIYSPYNGFNLSYCINGNTINSDKNKKSLNKGDKISFEEAGNCNVNSKVIYIVSQDNQKLEFKSEVESVTFEKNNNLSQLANLSRVLNIGGVCIDNKVTAPKTKINHYLMSVFEEYTFPKDREFNLSFLDNSGKCDKSTEVRVEKNRPFVSIQQIVSPDNLEQAYKSNTRDCNSVIQKFTKVKDLSGNEFKDSVTKATQSEWSIGMTSLASNNDTKGAISFMWSVAFNGVRGGVKTEEQTVVPVKPTTANPNPKAVTILPEVGATTQPVVTVLANSNSTNTASTSTLAISTTTPNSSTNIVKSATSQTVSANQTVQSTAVSVVKPNSSDVLARTGGNNSNLVLIVTTALVASSLVGFIFFKRREA
jgi:hypothetical protein